MYIEYRSIVDMNNIIVKNLQKLPHDIDLVVGIPRSGMLPANLIALYLNKPFTDIDSFLKKRIYSSGERGAFIDFKGSGKILVVDDSIGSGHALHEAKNKLANISEEFSLKYVVIFATLKGTKLVDYYFEVIDSPRIFQWNIFHHKTYIPHSCFDIDGVLCQNPPFDDDGPVYSEYLANAEPLYIPSLKIDTLVTCRLEKYRSITETWLRKNNVKYSKMIMLDFKTKEERQAWGKHGEYKPHIYRKSDNILFVESSLNEAITISKISNKPVFCTENFEMIIYNSGVKKSLYGIKLMAKKMLQMINLKI